MAVTDVQIPSGQNVVGAISTPDGFDVESNFETAEQLRTQLAETSPATETPVTEAPARRRNRREDPRAAVESAVGKQREAERLATEAADRAEKLEARLAELEKQPPKAAPAAQAPPIAAQAPPAAPAPSPVTQADYKRFMAMPDAPKDTDFTGETGWKDFQYAVNVFVADKRFDERMAQAQQMTAAQQTHAQFTQRLADAKTRIPDFDQRFNPQTPIDTRVFPYIQQLENAPDVMLYLSEHPDIAQRLTTLHPVSQIGQIGEIAGTLKAQSAAAASPASARPASSQAKPVAKRVTGQPPAATDEPPGDDASEEAHEAYWAPRRQDLRQHRRHR